MPVVTLKNLDASNDNSPHTANVDTQIDLAVLLSEHYGRNIRQGNSFKVNGVQAWLRPSDEDAGGIDSGVSAAIRLDYIPTTGHSRRAWNNVFKQWKAQKNLKGAVGSQIRFDDMEFAWHSASVVSGRTSTIFGTGIGDSNEEKLCLVGESTGGDDFSLKDYYNSAYETPQASRNHFDSTVIKEPKFGDTPFPEIQHIHCAATNSARVGVLGENAILGTSPEGITSAISTSDMNMLPSPVNVLCGTMRILAFIMPDDTADQIEEDFTFDISISVVSWKPLVYRPRRKTGRKSSKKSGGGRSGTKSTSKNARS